jgi:hypothetical protein
MIDPIGIEQRRASLQTVHLVALAQQKLGQIGPILTGDAGNESNLVV